jgi:hypothetical protein
MAIGLYCLQFWHHDVGAVHKQEALPEAAVQAGEAQPVHLVQVLRAACCLQPTRGALLPLNTPNSQQGVRIVHQIVNKGSE